MGVLPRILVIDDMLGRVPVGRRNAERASVCGQLLLQDVTGDGALGERPVQVKRPLAEAVFIRGQKPTMARLGDWVENDLGVTLAMVEQGWVSAQASRPPWSIVLVDLCFYQGQVTVESERARGVGMPEGLPGDDVPSAYFGLRILEALSDRFPDLPVVLLSSMPKDERVTLHYNSLGARAFLSKTGLDLAERLAEVLRVHGLFPDLAGEIVGHSLPLLLALRQARVCGLHRRKVLLRGERGTGKELFARFIHRHGVNAQGGELVAVNSSVLTDDLFASELFGHLRGAFTGAIQEKIGLVDEAEGGTLFLDEIKDLSPRVQAGLLRVLQENEITPVGANRPHPVDVRFLSATDIDIEGLAGSNQFRPALLDRLREGGTIVLPPLRARCADLPLLVEALVRRAEAANPRAVQREIRPDAVARLMERNWPDNLRGLASCLAEAVDHFPDNDQLTPRHLRFPESSIPWQERGGPSGGGAPAFDRPTEQGFDVAAVAYEALDATELPMALADLSRANAVATAALLRRACELSLRYGTGSDARVAIQPAIRLLTGRPNLSTTSAKRIARNLLSTISREDSQLVEDPILSRVAEQLGHTKREPKSR